MSAKLLDYKLHQGKKKGRLSHAQRAGLKYEAQVFAHLAFELERATYHPALEYTLKGHLRQYCIPDMIALDQTGEIVSIIEIKIRHTSDAWMQLNNLYRPVVAKLWPDKHINLVEICKEYDPAVRLPIQPHIVNDIADWVERPRQDYGVYLWRP